jgi:hypothetical protein
MGAHLDSGTQVDVASIEALEEGIEPLVVLRCGVLALLSHSQRLFLRPSVSVTEEPECFFPTSATTPAVGGMARVRPAWDACLRSWADAEGLHAGQDIMARLDARFDCQVLAYGPYFFANLAGTSDAEEQAAIDSGLIKANRIQYAGLRKSPPSVASA